ncbi:hypothetical protein [Bacillus sp. Bos-x628]|uniref:hypothetical protein n=1 Tax=Bacillus maqinnsis TaxID=3229854 RepID=UPI003390656B
MATKEEALLFEEQGVDRIYSNLTVKDMMNQLAPTSILNDGHLKTIILKKGQNRICI